MATYTDIKERVTQAVNEILLDKDLIIWINEALDDLSRVARTESNYIDILLGNIIYNGKDKFNVLNDKKYNKYLMEHAEDYALFVERGEAYFPKPQDFIRMIDMKLIKSNGTIIPINKTTIRTHDDYNNYIVYFEVNNKVYLKGNVQENDIVRFIYNCSYPHLSPLEITHHSSFANQEIPIDHASANCIVAFIVYKYHKIWTPDAKDRIELALFDYNKQKTEFVDEITINRSTNQGVRLQRNPDYFR